MDLFLTGVALRVDTQLDELTNPFYGTIASFTSNLEHEITDMGRQIESYRERKRESYRKERK